MTKEWVYRLLEREMRDSSCEIVYGRRDKREKSGLEPALIFCEPLV